MELLANNFATRTKKLCIKETDKKADEALMTNITQEKKVPMKHVRKKSSKAIVPISELVGKPTPDIQVLLINTNFYEKSFTFISDISKVSKENTSSYDSIAETLQKKDYHPYYPNC